MKRQYFCFFIVFCVLGIIVSCLGVLSLFFGNKLVMATNHSAPQWITFQVPLTGTLQDISVYQHLIYWSQYRYTVTNNDPCSYIGPWPYTPEASKEPYPPETMIWDVCLFDTRTYSLTEDYVVLGEKPVISQNWVVSVFTSHFGTSWFSTIRAFDLRTNTHYNIWSADYVVLLPRLDGNILLALLPDGVLKAYDLDKQLEVFSNYILAGSYDVSGDNIVWTQFNQQTQSDDVWGYNLASHNYFTITSQVDDENDVRIDGDIVIWHKNSNIYGYDLSNNHWLTITESVGNQINGTVSENFVAWLDDRNGQWDIYTYDLLLEQQSRVTITTDPTITRPELSSNFIVWLSGTGPSGTFSGQIHAARFMSHFSFLPLIQP